MVFTRQADDEGDRGCRRGARAGAPAAPGPDAGASAIIGSRAGPRARGGEVDLILRDRDGTLVFVEVRARRDATPRRRGGQRRRGQAAPHRARGAALPDALRLAAALPLRRGGDRRRAHRMAARRLRCRVTRPCTAPMEPRPREARVISSVPMLEQRIQQQFFDSADLKYAAAEILSKPIADAVNARGGLHHRRRQGAGLRQRRLGQRRAALRGRVRRPLRARAPRPGGDRADHRHVDPHRHRQRLRLQRRSSRSRCRRSARRATCCWPSPPAATRPTCWPRWRRRTPRR